MYEELVKRLRESCRDCKLWDGNECCLDGDCTGRARLQAADAIETLIGKVKYLINRCDMADKNCSEAVHLGAMWKEAALDQKPRWIPVTERLPECDLGAEVGNIEWISNGMVHAGCFGRGGKYRDAYFRTWTDEGEGMDAKDADYWRAVTLPEPPKEET